MASVRQPSPAATLSSPGLGWKGSQLVLARELLHCHFFGVEAGFVGQEAYVILRAFFRKRTQNIG